MAGCDSALAVIEMGEPAIGALMRQDPANERRVKALIRLECVQMNEMLNLPHGLTEPMIERIAATLTTRYRWLTLPDVHLVFDRAVNGTWNGGNYYSLVNVPMVEGWFAKYAEERMAVAEARSIAEAQNHKEWRERGHEADWRHANELARKLREINKKK